MISSLEERLTQMEEKAEIVARKAKEQLAFFRTEHQSMVSNCKNEIAILSRDKQTFEAQLVKANSEIEIAIKILDKQKGHTLLILVIAELERKIVNETGASLKARNQQSAALAQQIGLAASREIELSVEKDSAVAREVQLEAQVETLQTRNEGLVLDIQNLKRERDAIIIEKESLSNALADTESNIRKLKMEMRSARLEGKQIVIVSDERYSAVNIV
jgi:chromosome segregation ATPase